MYIFSNIQCSDFKILWTIYLENRYWNWFVYNSIDTIYVLRIFEIRKTCSDNSYWIYHSQNLFKVNYSNLFPVYLETCWNHEYDQLYSTIFQQNYEMWRLVVRFVYAWFIFLTHTIQERLIEGKNQNNSWNLD